MKKILTVLLLALPCLAIALGDAPQALAISVNYNNLIDDQVFDAQTMTAAQIDTFLNSFPSSCISSKNGFKAPDPVGYNPTDGFLFGSNVTAGKVIYDAASAYGLNPQVLLATLQKEQSLVTGGAGCHPNTPNPTATVRTSNTCTTGTTTTTLCTVACPYSGGCINIAVGYDCPQYCYAKSEGFSKQIVRAAWKLKWVRERAEGHVNWAVIKGNWDNSDDLNTTYYGPMAKGTYQRCSSCAATYYSGAVTLGDGSAIIENGATASLYSYTPFKSGNSHFVSIFTSWFGSVAGTPFFSVKGGDGKIYIQGADNTYYYVPNPTLMKAYGYGKYFWRIQAVSSSYLSGQTLKGNLPMIARFEADPVYLLDTGGAHHFPSRALLEAYGYSLGQEAALPDWLYNKLGHPEDMQLVITQTESIEVDYLQNGKRSPISSGAYSTMGSPVYSSQPRVRLSTSYVTTLPIGPPIVASGMFLKSSDTSTYGTWNGAQLQQINSTTATNIGFAPEYAGPSAAINQLAIGGTALGSLAKSSSGTLYLLAGGKKLALTNSQVTNFGLSSTDFIATNDTFLTKLATGSLDVPLIRINGGSAVYLVQSGKLYHVYSRYDLQGLGYSINQVLNIDTGTGALFTDNGDLLLAPGHLIRIDNQPEVYMISDTNARVYIPSRQVLSAFGHNINEVTALTSSQASRYTTGVTLAQVMKDGSDNYWLIDSGMKHAISSTLLSPSYYNIDTSGAATIPTNLLAPLANGRPMTNLIEPIGGPRTYRVENGKKRWFTSKASFTANGGNWNNIIGLSAGYIDTIPTGANIN